MTSNRISRRTLLGAALMGALLPAAASAQEKNGSNDQEVIQMRVRFVFNDLTMMATLEDHAASRDFYSMLPLDLTIEDFGQKEKIAHLPRKLNEEGSGPFDNEQPYDLCYYKPWGNLAMFLADYNHSGLIRLGKFDDGQQALHVKGTFPLRIEVA